MSIAADQRLKALEGEVKALREDYKLLKQCFNQFVDNAALASRHPALGLPKNAQRELGRH